MEVSKTIYITRGDKKKREKHHDFGNASFEQQCRVLSLVWVGWWCLCCNESLGRVMRLYADLTVSWPRDWGVSIGDKKYRIVYFCSICEFYKVLMWFMSSIYYLQFYNGLILLYDTILLFHESFLCLVIV